MTKLAVIFDRDGTLIRHVPYLADPTQVFLLPGVRDGLKRLQSMNALLFIHTNQSGVGRGLFKIEAVEACNSRLIEILDLGDCPFEKICIAPESPDQTSIYRKPLPTFAHDVMRDYQLEPVNIWYVGDRSSDPATAKAAGTSAVGVHTGLEDLDKELVADGMAGNYSLFERFDVAVDHIINQSLHL